MGKFPLGPSSTRPGVAWRAAWFWAVPKAIAPGQKDAAKKLLTWLGESDEVQLDVWKGTGGIPAVTRVQQRLAKEDPLFLQVKTVLIDAPYHITPAYYFKQWPEVHATFSDYATKALTGKREDIGKTLTEGGQKLSEIMRR
jgi:ABC-type glycerol-3-phosphate transport system substrate-binding protein